MNARILGVLSTRRRGQQAAAEEDAARSLECFSESLALFREIGDRGAMAPALYHIGYLLEAHGEPAGARPYFAESLSIAREIEDRWAAGACLVLIVLLQSLKIEGRRSPYELAPENAECHLSLSPYWLR